jgi:hypothetical protein
MITHTLVANLNDVDECLTYILIELNTPNPHPLYDDYKRLREEFKRLSFDLLTEIIR